MTRVTTHDFVTSPAYGRLTQRVRMAPQKPPPVIGNDVWIGANAVVSRDVPPYAIVGGNPAQHIRDRFTPSQVAALNRIRWWDWSPEHLQDQIDSFCDIDAFITTHDPGPDGDKPNITSGVASVKGTR